MILLIMGLLDLVAGVMVFFAKFGMFFSVSLVLATYLIIKGLIFWKSVTSILDVVCGIVIILLAFGYGIPFYWLASIWLVQKGIFSFL